MWRVWILPFLDSCVSAEQQHPLFIAFGDFGEDRDEFQKVVAELRRYPRAQFIALLGDLFYPKGVKSVNDAQFSIFKQFESVSDIFYPVLGNHDYGYAESPSALIAYSKVNPKWHMPSRYYSKRMRLEKSNANLCMFFIDTYVFDSDQKKWLESELSACQGEDTYRIIFGHHPIVSAGIYARCKDLKRRLAPLVPLIEKYNLDAYVSGHEHQMQALEKDRVHYLISGASSQLSRGKKGDRTLWKDKIKFVDDLYPGFLAFHETAEGLSYSFIRAADGARENILYSASLRKIAAPTTLPTTLPRVTTATSEEPKRFSESITTTLPRVTTATSGAFIQTRTLTDSNTAFSSDLNPTAAPSLTERAQTSTDMTGTSAREEFEIFAEIEMPLLTSHGLSIRSVHCAALLVIIQMCL